MEYIFSQREFEKLKKSIKQTEKVLAKITNAKAESGSGQDGWHDESFRVFLIEEQMWNKRLSELKDILSQAKVLTPEEQKEVVKFGNGVKILYEESGEIFEFILDGYLIDPCENKVSIYSPIARAIIGAKKGEKRTLVINGREIVVTILEIYLPSEAKQNIKDD